MDYPVKSEPDCIVFFAAVLYGLNEYVNSYVCVENENFISGCKKYTVYDSYTAETWSLMTAEPVVPGAILNNLWDYIEMLIIKVFFRSTSD